MEEKIFTATVMVLPRPWKQCNFTSVTVVVPRLYQQMIWRFLSPPIEGSCLVRDTKIFLQQDLGNKEVIVGNSVEKLPNLYLKSDIKRILLSFDIQKSIEQLYFLISLQALQALYQLFDNKLRICKFISQENNLSLGHFRTFNKHFLTGVL